MLSNQLRSSFSLNSKVARLTLRSLTFFNAETIDDDIPGSVGCTLTKDA